MGQEAGFVFHAVAPRNVEPEVEVFEPPLSAEFELFEDRIGPNPEVGIFGIVATIDGRKCVFGPIADGDADELGTDVVGEFEGVAAGSDEEVAVAVLVDRRLAISEVALLFVCVVDLNASTFDDGRTHLGEQFVVAAPLEPFLTFGELKFGGRKADGFTGRAGGTARAVKNEALPSIASAKASAKLFWRERSRREAQGQTSSVLLEVGAGLLSVVDDKLRWCALDNSRNLDVRTRHAHRLTRPGPDAKVHGAGVTVRKRPTSSLPSGSK